MTNLAFCHSSPSPPVILSLPHVILNEVKNRIVTKGKLTAEILHFVQDDKLKEHPPAPFKGGTLFVIFRLFDEIFGVY